jgi:predicted alpha/beta superfamily hydrolase
MTGTSSADAVAGSGPAGPGPARQGPAGPGPARLGVFSEPVASHVLIRRVVDAGPCGAYELFLAIPRTGGSGAPVLYMLDGNAAFDALTAPMLEAVPGLALVGVGYRTELRFDVLRRSHDYTPPTEAGHPGPDAARPERTIGGADRFLDALTARILPEAERHLSGAPSRRCLWGHSLAGLCTLYCLLTRPRAFDRYIAVSPSLWWADAFMLRLQQQMLGPGGAGPAAAGVQCLVMLGDSEKRSSAAGPHWDGPAPQTLRFAEALDAEGGVPTRLTVFPGLGHAATLPRSLEASLGFAAD